MEREQKNPVPRALKSYTYSIETPLGKAFVTINENGGNQPFEVFINTAKAGSETAAHSEAIGRLISYILRIASPIEPRDRLRITLDQLAGIGGGRLAWFRINRVRSLRMVFQKLWMNTSISKIQQLKRPATSPSLPIPCRLSDSTATCFPSHRVNSVLNVVKQP